MRASRVLVILAVALGALAGCSATVDGRGSAAPARAASPAGAVPSTGTSGSTGPVVDAVAAADLVTRLLPPPAGSTPWNDSWGTQTIVSVTAFTSRVYASGAAAQAARLSSEGILAIAHRTWIAADRTQADMVLMRFSSAAGALERYTYATAAKAAAPGVQSLDLGTALRGAAGYRDATADRYGNGRAILYAFAGPFVVELFYYCPTPFQVQPAVTWLAGQAARLS